MIPIARHLAAVAMDDFIEAMRRILRLVVLLAVAGCMPFMPLTCGSAPDVGQFGGYAGPYKLIRLPSGDTLTVYRVKYWVFTDSPDTALQIEYAASAAIDDTLAVKEEARRLWPVFRPYVERATLSEAIMTATRREVVAAGLAHATKMQHFGMIIRRDSSGDWHFNGEGGNLPPATRIGENGVGIFERDGQPLEVGPMRFPVGTTR